VSALFERRPTRGLVARGLARCYGDAAQNAGGAVVRSSRMASSATIDPDAGVATVDAGVAIGDLAARALPAGWFPAVVPGTSFVTVGGAIASDIHGKNHHADGGFFECIQTLDLVTPDGELRTIGPEREPELFEATVGGMGMTGVIVRAALRLRRIETDRIVADTERVSDLDEMLTRLESDDGRFRYSVAWIDCLARGGKLGRGALSRGNDATVDDLPPALRTRRPVLEQRPQLAAPRATPLVVRPMAMRVFNEAWFRRTPRRESGSLEPAERFFWPLDRVRDWNRLYGRHGLLQYQFAVPSGHEKVLQFALERFAAHGHASLGVLKRFGPGRGLLSFPIEGWTLAVDAPARAAGLASLLDELDEAVAGAGGRVYLAKDSRMRPELLPAMYPELERWRGIQAAVDPDGVLCSDMARRVGLLGR
jgi:decaprenylphospho-beta-D-ribofuranose 2-oxidase